MELPLQHCSHTVLLRSPHADSIDKKLVVWLFTYTKYKHKHRSMYGPVFAVCQMTCALALAVLRLSVGLKCGIGENRIECS